MPYQPTKEQTEKLGKAKALLVLDHPFFASTLLKKPIAWVDPADPEIKTLAVDARGSVYLNPAFVDKLDTQQLIWGLAHECLHYMLLHPARKGQRKMGPWNWSCDAIVNDTLDDAKVGTRIPDMVNVPNARTMKAEDLYQEPPPGSGQGGGLGDRSPTGVGEDLIDGPLTEGEVAEIEAQVKVEMAQARNIAKMQGKLPTGIARMVDEIINVKTPWHSILERYMTSFVKADPSWSRPNRRFMHAQMYLPGVGYTPQMGEVVIGVDTSGSVGGPELAEFEGHLNAILDQCKPEKVTVVYCDARVGSVDEYAPDELPARFKNVTGGGGTDFTPVFEYVDEQGIEPDVLVYLTDGYGGCAARTPDYPVVWLTTGKEEFPFGDVIKFEG